MKNIIIIGTGLAGYLFAKEFRKIDAHSKLTMITNSDGYFYSKPLLSTALANKKTPDALTIHSVDTMRNQLNANIYIQCAVHQIDAQNKKIFFKNENNQENILSYDQLILANGADPVEITLEGDGVSGILHVNQLEDYRLFFDKIAEKKRITILGTGLVGCEFSNDLAIAGYDVTVISPDDYLLKKWVPEIISRALEKKLSDKKVNFKLSVFPKIIHKKNNGYEIVLSNGEKITADVVLSAVGIKPNLSLAHTAHLKTNIGIQVNHCLQTSDPNIYALGDCAEVNGEMKMYVAPIMQHARILAEVLASQTPLIQSQIMPITIKTSLCPIVVVPPSKKELGEWKVIAEDANIQALFYHNNILRGFSLSGSCVKEKMRLIKEMGEQ